MGKYNKKIDSCYGSSNNFKELKRVDVCNAKSTIL